MIAIPFSRCPLGEDLKYDVLESNIKCKYIKLTDLLQENNREKAANVSNNCSI